jgi:hypothetical protein
MSSAAFGPFKDSPRIRKPRASLNDDYRFELIFGKLPTYIARLPQVLAYSA